MRATRYKHDRETEESKASGDRRQHDAPLRSQQRQQQQRQQQRPGPTASASSPPSCWTRSIPALSQNFCRTPRPSPRTRRPSTSPRSPHPRTPISLQPKVSRSRPAGSATPGSSYKPTAPSPNASPSLTTCAPASSSAERCVPRRRRSTSLGYGTLSIIRDSSARVIPLRRPSCTSSATLPSNALRSGVPTTRMP